MTLALVVEEWGGKARADMATIKGDDIPPDWYGVEIEAKRAWLWGVYDDGKRVGSVVMRAEPHPMIGFEWVILAGAGSGDRLFQRAVPMIEAAATAAGAGAVRWHTLRPGMVKLARDAGYGVAEIVLRKAVA
ncbi:hypothetical protein ABWI00_06035 [Algihabitans albus]|uniref:hypothetical protein n=1 Tax=Algihabitans albus TaxID=2164067 RepID=UPI0035D0DDBC